MKNKRNNFEDESTEFFDREDDFDERKEDKGDETKIDYEMRGRESIDEIGTTIDIQREKPKLYGFIVIKKGRQRDNRFDLKEDMIIGKSQRCCDLVLDDEDISRIHSRIKKDPEKNEFHFYDCGSTNGCFINGKQVYHAILKDHDKIKLGDSVEIEFIHIKD